MSAEYKKTSITFLERLFPYIKKDIICDFFNKNSKDFIKTLEFIEQKIDIKIIWIPVKNSTYNFDTNVIINLNQTCQENFKSEINKCKINNIGFKKSFQKILPVVPFERKLFFQINSINGLTDDSFSENEIENTKKSNDSIFGTENDPECLCCYNNFDPSFLYCCTDGHLFCKNCITKPILCGLYEGMILSKRCIWSNCCEGYFTDQILKSLISIKDFEKLELMLIKKSILSSGIDDITYCRNCNDGYSLEQEQQNLTCPMCHFKTCKLCGLEPHSGLTCKEYQNSLKSDNIRLQLEEKMSELLIRSCHKCKSNIVKMDGCNKINCQCGSVICDVCSKDITKEGYKHFNNPKIIENKCPLYDDSKERAVKEFNKVSAEMTQNIDVNLKGEVEKIKESIRGKNTKRNIFNNFEYTINNFQEYNRMKIEQKPAEKNLKRATQFLNNFNQQKSNEKFPIATQFLSSSNRQINKKIDEDEFKKYDPEMFEEDEFEKYDPEMFEDNFDEDGFEKYDPNLFK